ncbi:MAG: hypothetical protein KDA53_04090 [Hyphomonas sp.]|nr:hypothetical protein [Hyphomonas sp.]
MNPVVIAVLLAFLVGLALATWKAPRLTGILWWSLLATILSTAALLLSLPFDFGQLALWLTLAVPLIWMAFMFLCYWDRSKWRVPISLVLISVASAIAIAIVPPPA